MVDNTVMTNDPRFVCVEIVPVFGRADERLAFPACPVDEIARAGESVVGVFSVVLKVEHHVDIADFDDLRVAGDAKCRISGNIVDDGRIAVALKMLAVVGYGSENALSVV